MKEELVVDTDYDKGFYDQITQGSIDSAKEIVPWMIRYALPANVHTLVDVGCGRGVWGYEFQERGFEVLGIDGPYVTDPVIPFQPHDLREPLVLDKKYDVALCLEVAEHLPEQYADTLIKSLVDASEIIIFSAAIPHQTGHGHVNCQWPSYWAEKFSTFGYIAEDYREAFWSNPNVEPWYAQNILLFRYDGEPPLMHDYGMLDVVHPTIHGWGR